MLLKNNTEDDTCSKTNNRLTRRLCKDDSCERQLRIRGKGGVVHQVAIGIVGEVADAYIGYMKRQATRLERTAAMLKEQRAPKLGCHLSYAMAGEG